MKLSDKQKRYIAMAVLVIGALILLWLLFGKKMGFQSGVRSAASLAPEAVSTGGEAAVPNYLTYNVVQPAASVQKQPPQAPTTCCANAPACGCSGRGDLLATTSQLITDYNKQITGWADNYYNALLETAPNTSLTVGYSQPIASTQN